MSLLSHCGSGAVTHTGLMVGKGGTMEDFYKTTKWIRKRSHILRRDGYQCQECRKYGRMTPAVYVHHIQHLEDRPDLALVDSNLESVCMACHNKLHPEKGTKSRRMQRGR